MSNCSVARLSRSLRVSSRALAVGCLFVSLSPLGLTVIEAGEPQAAETKPRATFVNRTADLIPQLSGGKAAWVDVDNDGWSDLCSGRVVWKNNAGKGFVKLAEGPENIAADFDNDGFADLFSWSSQMVYRNRAGKSFEEIPMPKLPTSVSMGACWGDFNNDGFVDLYVGGYEDWDRDITYPSFVLMNEAGKTFKLVQTDTRYRARGITACDFDRDGDLDVYVSNYRLQPNLLWINDGSGKFTDGAAAANAVAASPGYNGGHSIGSAWGDFDNDGHIDLFAGNFAHAGQPESRFLRNVGEKGKPFEDRGPSGVFYQESYASPGAADYDNDGDLDLFYTTVYGTASGGVPNHPVLFRNDGGFKFSDDTAAAKLSALEPTYEAAWADYDHDGDLDLVTAGKLFENQSAKARWLEVRLAGDGNRVNRSAIGAQVRVLLPNRTLTRQVEAGTGEGNQNDLTLHFGLGDHSTPVSLEIFWPKGTVQKVENMAVDQLLPITLAK